MPENSNCPTCAEASEGWLRAFATGGLLTARSGDCLGCLGGLEMGVAQPRPEYLWNNCQPCQALTFFNVTPDHAPFDKLIEGSIALLNPKNSPSSLTVEGVCLGMSR